MNRTPRERIQSLQIKNVTHCYGEGEGKVEILKDITFQLPLGKTIILEGDPGSGKSLLLKIMAGIVEPTVGEVIYNGRNLSNISFEEFTQTRLSTTICFENGGLINNKTLLENMKLGLMYHGGWRMERSDGLLRDLIENFQIGKFLNLRPSAVSTGVRKMAGLVRSFVSNAQILFLDEPSLGLGTKGAEALKYWMDKYRNEGKHDEVIIMACSDHEFVEAFECVRLNLKDGKLTVKNYLPPETQKEVA